MHNPDKPTGSGNKPQKRKRPGLDDFTKLLSGQRNSHEESDAVPSILQAQSGDAQLDIDIESIRVSKYQFPGRGAPESEYVQSLAESIKSGGLIQRILVRPLEFGVFELIAGENRIEAHKLLGRTKIPAIVRHMDDRMAARQLLADNLARLDPTPWQICQAITQQKSAGFLGNDEDIAELIGKSKSYVSQVLSMNALPERAKKILDEHPGCIGITLAAELKIKGLNEDAPDLVAEALERIATNSLQQNGAINWINAQKKKPVEKPQIRDNTFKLGKRKLRCVSTDDGMRVTCKGMNAAALEALIMQNLALIMGEEAPTKS